MHLKYTSRISVSALKSLISGISSNTSSSHVVETFYTPCEQSATCMYVDSNPDYCKDYCPNRKKNEKVISFEEDDTYNFVKYPQYTSTKFYAKKNLIKQYILYHFLLHGTNKIRRKIRVRDIAKKLGVTVATIRANNKILTSLGLVYFTDINSNVNDIVIVNENKLHLKRSEGGSGYITLTSSDLETLLGLTTTEAVRADLANLLLSESLSKTKVDKIKFEKMFKYFPKHMIKQKGKLKSLLSDAKSAALIELNKSNVFKINREYTYIKIKNIKKRLESKLTQFMYSKDLNIFDNKFNKNEFNGLTPSLKKTVRRSMFDNILDNLVGLCIEFSYDMVISQLLQLDKMYTSENIQEVGALIRTRLNIMLSDYGSNTQVVCQTFLPFDV